MFRAVPQVSIWAATSSQCFIRIGVPPLRLPARHLQARCLASRRDRFSEILDEGLLDVGAQAWVCGRESACACMCFRTSVHTIHMIVMK